MFFSGLPTLVGDDTGGPGDIGEELQSCKGVGFPMFQTLEFLGVPAKPRIHFYRESPVKWVYACNKNKGLTSQRQRVRKDNDVTQ